MNKKKKRKKKKIGKKRRDFLRRNGDKMTIILKSIGARGGRHPD